MIQNNIDKVIKHLKNKPDNEKAYTMVEQLQKDTIDVKGRKGVIIRQPFTPDAKWNYAGDYCSG